MYTHPQQGLQQEDVLKLRQAAGSYIKQLREAARLSQRDLAKVVGLEYYTFVSQIESGRGRVPPAQMPVWAKALNVPPRDFAMNLMRFYDPISYEMIFGQDTAEPAAAPEQTRDELEARIAKLESRIGNGK
jgi:transcriptional regulator with XRE-family HTH domain